MFPYPVPHRLKSHLDLLAMHLEYRLPYDESVYAIPVDVLRTVDGPIHILWGLLV